jgi:hypothetical protein
MVTIRSASRRSSNLPSVSVAGPQAGTVVIERIEVMEQIARPSDIADGSFEFRDPRGPAPARRVGEPPTSFHLPLAQYTKSNHVSRTIEMVAIGDKRSRLRPGGLRRKGAVSSSRGGVSLLL